MLLYDVSNEHSFLNVRKWINDIGEQVAMDQAKLPIVVVGNKTDLRAESGSQSKLYVSTSDGARMAHDCGASFVESSVKSGECVMQALGALVLQMIANEDNMIRNTGISLTGREKSKFLSCCFK